MPLLNSKNIFFNFDGGSEEVFARITQAPVPQ
jgi:hypothetical protein